MPHETGDGPYPDRGHDPLRTAERVLHAAAFAFTALTILAVLTGMWMIAAMDIDDVTGWVAVSYAVPLALFSAVSWWARAVLHRYLAAEPR